VVVRLNTKICRLTISGLGVETEKIARKTICQRAGRATSQNLHIRWKSSGSGLLMMWHVYIGILKLRILMRFGIIKQVKSEVVFYLELKMKDG